MKKTSEIYADFPFPSLARAVVRRAGVESMRDVSEYGADYGFPGFIYYSDTVAFFRAHKADIVALVRNRADVLGEDALSMVAGFRYIAHDYRIDEVGRALYGRYDSELDGIYNVLAWFALEEVAAYFDC